MSSNVHGVPMGIVESPLLFSEIVPDTTSEKRLARAGIPARVRKASDRSAALAKRVFIGMTVLTFCPLMPRDNPPQVRFPSNDSYCRAKAANVPQPGLAAGPDPQQVTAAHQSGKKHFY